MSVVALRAVIFDMDGLMLDTERIALKALSEAAISLGYPWREEIGLAMVGLNIRDSDAVVARHLGASFAIEPLRAAFGERYLMALEAEPIPIKPGLLEFLDWLEGRGVPKAVATSTRSERARLKLDRAGIGDRFQLVVCGDQVSRGKPEPDIFLAAADGLRIAAEACLALEDSGPGVRAATAAGMKVIMIPDVLAPSADVIALGHPICPSLIEALQLVQENFTVFNENLPVSQP
jgi:HAD superfamily hydrolase (TIGR01509 family)